MCSVVDGIIRGAYYGFYASACVLARRNLGDGYERRGYVNFMLVYIAAVSKDMARWSMGG